MLGPDVAEAEEFVEVDWALVVAVLEVPKMLEGTAEGVVAANVLGVPLALAT